jgi:hypothetical protein
MSDDKLHDATVRGAKADGLLKDELLREAFASLEKDYLDAWRTSPARDTDGRERLWQAVNIVGKVRDHLVIALNNGKLAQRQIDELTERDAVKSAARKPR